MRRKVKLSRILILILIPILIVSGSVYVIYMLFTQEESVIEKKIVVEQKSDFTGEIEHACTCIESGLIESPIMSRNASLEILKVIGV